MSSRLLGLLFIALQAVTFRVIAQDDSSAVFVTMLNEDGSVRFEGTVLNNQYFTGTEFERDSITGRRKISYWRSGVPEDTLRAKIRSLYEDVLNDYFVDTVGARDIEKYGFNFVVSTPHALKPSFSVRDKPFLFHNPPYHDLFVSNLFLTKVKKSNAGRHAYFIYDNSDWRGRLPDTLEVTLYEYVFTGREGRRKGDSMNWEACKIPLVKYYYVPDRRGEWIEVKQMKLR